jgi:NAD(P)-dependent dehydrogenase (short-subunit alcohol dehydrogenase family)
MIVQTIAGRIINISSIWGLLAGEGRLAYCVSKAGVIMLTKALAVEWAKYQIRVNCIATGYVRTEGLAARFRDSAFTEAALSCRTPLGRIAEPAEVARVALFLAADDSSFLTGQTVFVDGGWNIVGNLVPPGDAV